MHRRILVLGTSTGAADAIAYMHTLGFHVIITDNSAENHPAKDLADVVRNVSTQNLGALEELCENEAIDGVFSGINEANIRTAIHLAERFGLPYFCTMSQWRRIMDKGEFRSLCIDSELPTPRTYYVGQVSDFPEEEARVEFPCIVKPVDSSALRGISVCYSLQEVSVAVEEAGRSSRTGATIVEELIVGDEFTAAYVVVDGIAVLSSVDDRVPLKLEGMTTTFPVVRVYPSLNASRIATQCDEAVQTLCEKVGLRNCCIFIQGIVSDDRVAVFEAGLRLAAETPYRFLEGVNGVNQLHHFVDASLGLASKHLIEREDPNLGGRVCAIVSFVGNGGVIARIEGLEDVLTEVPQVTMHELRHGVGSQIPADGSLRQIALRFILNCADREELRSVVDLLTDSVAILDDQGNLLAQSVSGDVWEAYVEHAEFLTNSHEGIEALL